MVLGAVAAPCRVCPHLKRNFLPRDILQILRSILEFPVRSLSPRLIPSPLPWKCSHVCFYLHSIHFPIWVHSLLVRLISQVRGGGAVRSRGALSNLQPSNFPPTECQFQTDSFLCNQLALHLPYSGQPLLPPTEPHFQTVSLLCSHLLHPVSAGGVSEFPLDLDIGD